MKKITSVLSIILIACIFCACEKDTNEELIDLEENSSSDELYQYILDLGFDAESIVDQKDVYLVEGVIEFPKTNFNKESSEKSASLVTLYRYYNSSVGDHLYVTSPVSYSGYRYEGTQGRIYSSATSGTVPLYKYYSIRDTDHFYTTNFSELGNGRNGYYYQGIIGYVFSNSASGRSRLYRYYSASQGDHFYTTNFSELGYGRLGYTYEGIQCYVIP